MPRPLRAACVTTLIILALLSAKAIAESQAGTVLIFAPHPDDETIACGGIIQEAVASGGEVRVVFVTNGDAFRASEMMAGHSVRSKWEKFVSYGKSRQAESLAALARLCVPQDNTLFLGYPDSGLLRMWEENWKESKPFWSRYTRSADSPYENSLTRDAPYAGRALLLDICAILRKTRPREVYVPHPDDAHPDHMATHAFVLFAIQLLALESIDSFSPRVKTYVVHSSRWPDSGAIKTDEELTPPSDLTKAGYQFDSVQLSPAQAETKLLALKEYKSQLCLREHFLSGFIRENELFWSFHPLSLKEAGGIVIDGDDGDWQGIEPSLRDPLRNETLLKYVLSEPAACLTLMSDDENLYALARFPKSRLSKRYEITFRPVLPAPESDACWAIDMVFDDMGSASATIVSPAGDQSSLEKVAVKSTSEFAEVQVPREYFRGAKSFFVAFKTHNSSQAAVSNRTGYRLAAFP